MTKKYILIICFVSYQLKNITNVSKATVTIFEDIAKYHGKTGHVFFFWKQFVLD